MDETGLTVQASWFRLLAHAGYPVLDAADGAFAVRTGLGSNTENGAVLTGPVLRDPDRLDALLAHATDGGLPASALLAGPGGADDVAALVARGWRPERGAHEMVGPLVVPDRTGPDGVTVREVVDDDGLDAHVAALRTNDWYEDDAEQAAALDLARRLGHGPGQPVRRWVATAEGRPVGAAVSALVPGTTVVALTTLCVAGAFRRRGIGTALTRARLVAAAADGATTVHVSPSPDGAALHTALGLVARPTPPDRWFYSPAPPV